MDETGLSWGYTVIEISKRCGIDIISHIHNESFDIGTWWSDVVSKVPEEVIQHWLEHMPEDKNSFVVNEMRTTLEEEIRTRKHVASEFIQSRIGVNV